LSTPRDGPPRHAGPGGLRPGKPLLPGPRPLRGAGYPAVRTRAGKSAMACRGWMFWTGRWPRPGPPGSGQSSIEAGRMIHLW